MEHHCQLDEAHNRHAHRNITFQVSLGKLFWNRRGVSMKELEAIKLGETFKPNPELKPPFHMDASRGIWI